MYKIAIIGQQCSGKTSVCDRIARHFTKPYKLKFADPIYDVLKVMGEEKNRLFMQEYSDLAKKHFGQDIFLKLFERRHNLIWVAAMKNAYADVMLCDDIRYYNELLMAVGLQFWIFYVEAPEEIRKSRAEAQKLVWSPDHNSETEVPSLKPMADFVINNDSNVNELYRRVDWAINQMFNTKKIAH